MIKEEKKNYIYRNFQLIKEFENIIDIINGIYIILNEKSSKSLKLYFNKKKYYLIYY